MKFFWVSFVFFILAVLVSEKAIMFPFIILLYEWSLGTVMANKNKLLWLFGITFVLGISVAFYAFDRLAGLASAHYLENGFDNPFITLPLAIGSYLYLIVWPQTLTLYQTEIVGSIIIFWAKVIVTILFGILLVLSFRKNKFIFFCLSFFVASLLPMLLPIRIAWIVAERYAYMGLIGIFACFGYLFSKLYERENYRQAGTVIGVIILVLLSIRTIIRNRDWKNEDTLWIATVKASPNSPNAHNNMGDYYARYGRHDLAAEEFMKAIKLKQNYADAYHNYANSLQNLGRIDEAKVWYEKTLQINPNIWQTYAQLASIAAQKKEYGKAEELLLHALKLSPNNPDVYMNLAVLSTIVNDVDKAKQYYQLAIAINPNHPKGPEVLKRISGESK